MVAAGTPCLGGYKGAEVPIIEVGAGRGVLRGVRVVRKKCPMRPIGAAHSLPPAYTPNLPCPAALLVFPHETRIWAAGHAPVGSSPQQLSPVGGTASRENVSAAMI